LSSRRPSPINIIVVYCSQNHIIEALSFYMAKAAPVRSHPILIVTCTPGMFAEKKLLHLTCLNPSHYQNHYVCNSILSWFLPWFVGIVWLGGLVATVAVKGCIPLGVPSLAGKIQVSFSVPWKFFYNCFTICILLYSLKIRIGQDGILQYLV
jgi:hypothetical protein